MIIKTSAVDDFKWNEEPVSLIPVGSHGVDNGYFEKKASFLTDSRASLRPRPGYTPVFVLAMGAGEYFSSNRNADYWPKSAGVFHIHRPAPGKAKEAHITAGLKERADTFVTHGLIYKDHKNTSASLSKGLIHSACYNPDAGRVEVVALLKNADWPLEIEKLARNEHVPFSMSARVKHDICSLCGNTATNRSQYCEHMLKHANAVLDDGSQIFAINERPTFFDLSGVWRPADRIAYGLAAVSPQEVQKSAQLIIEDPWVKIARNMLQKLSVIEKQIDGCGSSLPDLLRSRDPRLSSMLSSQQLGILTDSDPGAVFNSFSMHKVMLPLREFSRITLGDSYDDLSDVVDRAEERLPGLFNRVLQDDDVQSFMESGRYSPDKEASVPASVNTIAGWLAPMYSLAAATSGTCLATSIAIYANPPLRKVSAVIADPKSDALLHEYVSYVLHNLDKNASNGELTALVLSNYCAL